MPQIFVKFQRKEGILMRVLPGRFFYSRRNFFYSLTLDFGFSISFWMEGMDRRKIFIFVFYFGTI